MESETYTENKNREVFNIDFDGTLTTGEYNDNPGPDEEIIKKIKKLYMNGHLIIIWTARWWNEAPFLVSWLIKNCVPYHGIMMGKGGSDYYIDDKSITLKQFLNEK